MIRGILWDYDGTIAETLERQFSWFKEWARANDKRIDLSFEDFREVYNRECDRGVQKVYDFFGLPCDMGDMGHPVWAAYEHFKRAHPVKFYSGIPKAIRDIHRLGDLGSSPSINRRLRMAINTTNTWRTIHEELGSHRVLGYFDSFITREVLDSYDGARNDLTKPSKVSVALSLDTLGCEGDQVIHIGDTISDLRASTQIRRPGRFKIENLVTVGVSWGYDGRDVLERGFETGSGTVNFDYIVDSPLQVTQIVEGLSKARFSHPQGSNN